MRLRHYLFSILLVISLFSLNLFSNSALVLAASSAPDGGRLNGSTYTNNYFGLNIKIPAQWQIQNKEAIQQMQDKGNEMIAGNNQNRKKELEKASQNTINMLVLIHEPTSANFVAVAEKISFHPGIKTGSDYLASAKKILQSSQLKYRFKEKMYSVKFNNRLFNAMDCSITQGNQVINQTYYASITKGYALSFIITYVNNEQYNALKPLLKSIQFSK